MTLTRQKLPTERSGKTHKVVIGGRAVYITTGEYPDGSLGEIFIRLDREGGELRVYDCLAIAVSIGLQYGVPLEEYIKKLRYQQMEPRGVTSNPNEIPMCSSISDYLAKWLELKYLSNKQPDQW